MQLSKRLMCLSDMVEPGSNIIDVGCDHGLLDIYLTLNKNCSCIASDISSNVLKKTIINISKYNLKDRIKVICSDGLKNILVPSNPVMIISGMGTSTIIGILKNPKLCEINNLIIQSNNELELLRRFVIKQGFYIFLEKIISDNNKDYVVIYFKRGYKRYFLRDYLFGPIARKNMENRNYYLNLYKKNVRILNKIPIKHLLKKIKQYFYVLQIKKFTCMKF